MAWGCVWEGRRQVAGGGREEAGREWGLPEHREGHIPGYSAEGKNKGAPILCLGLQTAAPSPQLPVPPTSLGITLGMQSEARASPSPPVPRQQALSPQPPPTCESLTLSLSPAGSAAETGTQPLSFSPQALDGGGQTSEQPQPGQQRLHHLLPGQPEHQGSNFLEGLGRRAGLRAAPFSYFPAPGSVPTQGIPIVKGKDT